jgi:hypothetical protein
LAGAWADRFSGALQIFAEPPPVASSPAEPARRSLNMLIQNSVRRGSKKIKTYRIISMSVLGSTVCGFLRYFMRELEASEEGESELVFSETTYFEREN